MMLTVVVLVAWSTSIVAAHESTTWNATHIPVSNSNVDMESINYVDNYEERTASVPEEIERMVNQLYAPMINHLPENEQKTKMNTLILQFHNLYEKFIHLKSATKKDQIFDELKKVVVKLHADFPEEVKYQTIFAILKHHSKDQDDLMNTLVTQTKVGPRDCLAEKLLNVQLYAWVGEKREVGDIFMLLKLPDNENPFGDSLFLKWVIYVQARYHRSPQDIDKEMLKVLRKHFGNDDALASALVLKTEGSDKLKIIAQNLLDSLFKKWILAKENEANAFERLKLHLISDNLFDSPLFSAWVGFVRLKYSDDRKATVAMISTLRDVYKDNLSRVLAEGTKTQNERMKAVAEGLQNVLGEGSTKSLKRQRSFDLNDPPLKRQRSFDLNEHSPEMNVNPPSPRAV